MDVEEAANVSAVDKQVPTDAVQSGADDEHNNDVEALNDVDGDVHEDIAEGSPVASPAASPTSRSRKRSTPRARSKSGRKGKKEPRSQDNRGDGEVNDDDYDGAEAPDAETPVPPTPVQRSSRKRKAVRLPDDDEVGGEDLDDEDGHADARETEEGIVDSQARSKSRAASVAISKARRSGRARVPQGAKGEVLEAGAAAPQPADQLKDAEEEGDEDDYPLEPLLEPRPIDGLGWDLVRLRQLAETLEAPEFGGKYTGGASRAQLALQRIDQLSQQVGSAGAPAPTRGSEEWQGSSSSVSTSALPHEAHATGQLLHDDVHMAGAASSDAANAGQGASANISASTEPTVLAAQGGALRGMPLGELPTTLEVWAHVTGSHPRDDWIRAQLAAFSVEGNGPLHGSVAHNLSRSGRRVDGMLVTL